MKTYSAKKGELSREWYVVDAEGQILGRLATQIADRLRGKGKPQYTAHVDTGDFVIVVNAEKIAVTGKKLDDKLYYRHSGYPGGLKQRTLREQLDRRPTEVIRKAVKGMLPRNKLANQQITKLKIYAGPEHPHEAQAPKPLLMSTTLQPPRLRAQYLGTGKRKTSVARVILRPGDGKTWINGKTIEEYFPRAHPPRDGAVAAQGDGARGPVRPPGPRPRRRPVRPGRRGSPRHRPRARRGEPGLPHPAEARRASSRATPARSSARRPACTRRARRPSSRSGKAALSRLDGPAVARHFR